MFVPSWNFVLSDSVKIYIFKAYNLTVLLCVDMHGIKIHMKALNYIKLLFTSNQANWFEAMRLHNSIVIYIKAIKASAGAGMWYDISKD